MALGRISMVARSSDISGVDIPSPATDDSLAVGGVADPKETTMNETTRRLASAGIAGGLTIIAAGMAVLVELPDGATLADVSGVAWAIIIGGGVATAMKDIQALLAPPVKPRY